MRWSEAVTLEFVKIYLKQECLWNPAHPGYKMKAQREKSYFSIITEFKDSTSKTLTVPEVKMKIKNLRTTYVQQVHKILQKSNPDSMYEPSLVWFHEMDRCLKHVPNHRHPTAYNTVPEAPEVDSSTQIWVDHEMQNGNMEETNPDPLVPQMEEEYTAKSPPPSRVKKEKHSPIYKKNKKKKFKHKAAIQDYSTDSNSEIVGKEDEFDIYGKYIASQLRKMDLYKALRLQLEIQNLVSEARIFDITSD